MFRIQTHPRRQLRHALGLLMIAGVFATPLPALASAKSAELDQVYRYIEKVKGKTSAKRYSELIVTSAEKHGLPPLLVANLIMTESSFNPRAISPMGAIGLMQVMPFHYTKRRIPISKWHDPALNIDLGCQIYASYRAMMDKRYPGLSPEALQHRTLVAYNMGPRAVVSRGIYRSRYSQKILQDTMLAAVVPAPAAPAPPPEPMPAPVTLTPIPWEELPLGSSRLSVAFGAELPDALRVGHAPEAVFYLPPGGLNLPRSRDGAFGTP